MTIWGMFTQVFGRIPLETPKYEKIKSTDDYEIRSYQPCVVAEITYDLTNVKDADDYGFQILGSYIGVIGNPKNAKNSAPEPIAMTVPVIKKESETIAMTVPVVKKEGGGGGMGEMTIQFFLPGKYGSVEAAPRPLDDRVKVKEVGERRYGVVRYRGLMKSLKEKVAMEKEEKLRRCLERDGYRVVGESVLARYDPPWTLPFLRTNDIMVPIE